MKYTRVINTIASSQTKNFQSKNLQKYDQTMNNNCCEYKRFVCDAQNKNLSENNLGNMQINKPINKPTNKPDNTLNDKSDNRQDYRPEIIDYIFCVVVAFIAGAIMTALVQMPNVYQTCQTCQTSPNNTHTQT